MEQQIHNVGVITGTRDTTYNLISMIYHSLQGAETYLLYMQDAEKAGESEIAQFFSEAIDENRDRAEKAKSYLAKRLSDLDS